MSDFALKKRLPPYGKTVCPIAGSQLSVVYGWPPEGQKPQRDVMVLPDDFPERYTWPVKGCDVLVAAMREPIPVDVGQRLYEALVESGAKSIVIYGTRHDDSGALAGLHFWPESIIEVAP